MRAYPLLNLSEITPDPKLVDQVPHALASYYMALPLAREDDRVSVAMEHPENDTAVAMLSRLLGGAVVPVRGAADAIRSALTALRPSPPDPSGCVLGWNERPEWFAAVDAWTRVLADLLGVSAAVMSSAEAPFDSFSAVAAAERYRVVVVDSPISALLDRTLLVAAGPLLLVRSPEVHPLRRLLIVLRGYSSDELALEWALAFAQSAETSLTFMSLNGGGRPLGPALQETLAAKSQQLGGPRSSGQPTGIRNLHAYLKVRTGDSAQQVCDEAEDGAYDLIVVCAEGEGEFVGRTLAALEQRSPHSGCPVLIVKPSF